MPHRILPRALRLGSMHAWRGVALAGLLGLAVLVGWALVLRVEARRQARHEARRSAAVVAQSVAREHERLLDTARQLLLALAQRPEIVTANRAACPGLLARMLGAVPGYLDLAAAKPDGEVFCSARGALRLPVGLDVADVRRTAESGNPSRGRYGIDRALGRPTVALAMAAIDEAGTVRAVVAASLDLGQLERVMVESPLPAGATLMLVDANGMILSHYAQPERWRGEILDESLRPLLGGTGEDLVETAWLDDVPSLVLVEPLSRDTRRIHDATVVVALPQRSVFGDVSRLFGLGLAGLGLLALAGLVCGALAMDQLVGRPAQGLLRVIRSLNAGDVRARMRRIDERHGLVGRLARSVNALGRRLEEHQQTVRHLEDQLRDERTARVLAPLPPIEPAVVTLARADAAAARLAARPEPPAAGAATDPAAEPAATAEEYGWGLREPPFENAPNPRFLWLSPAHSDALVRLTYALRQRRGCALLTGDPGCGKTLLTRAVVQRLDPTRYEIGLLTNPHGGRIDLLRQVLYELGVETTETARAELLHMLNELVVGTTQRGRETLIIVDDAQQVEDPAWFEELSSLLNIQTNERTLVTLLLAGTPELGARIQRVQHLDRRVSIRCALAPLTSEQTAQYIRYRLTVAGGEASMFARDATLLIYQASRGVPRAINDLCDSALLLARLDALPGVDGGVVRRVLSATPTAPEASAEAPPSR